MNLIHFSDCEELTVEECTNLNGGFLPLAVIGVCWGAMIVMSAVAAGMKSELEADANHH